MYTNTAVTENMRPHVAKDNLLWRRLEIRVSSPGVPQARVHVQENAALTQMFTGLALDAAHRRQVQQAS
jgi:hypothetical protein